MAFRDTLSTDSGWKYEYFDGKAAQQGAELPPRGIEAPTVVDMVSTVKRAGVVTPPVVERPRADPTGWQDRLFNA